MAEDYRLALLNRPFIMDPSEGGPIPHRILHTGRIRVTVAYYKWSNLLLNERTIAEIVQTRESLP